MKFSIKDFFSKCQMPNPQKTTEEVFNGKPHFLCSDISIALWHGTITNCIKLLIVYPEIRSVVIF